jgi:hypothetical protein
MWHIQTILVQLVNDKNDETESLVYGNDRSKAPEDFTQMVLFEIAAHLASRNLVPGAPPTPELPAPPRAPTNRPARSLATAGKKLQGRKH